jgi:hypothetical protein
MKKTFFLVGLILSLTSHAQTEIKKEGGYLNFDSFRNNLPEFVGSIEVAKRSDFDIKMVAGNGYKISSPDKKINAKIKHDIWGVYMKDTLFVNGKFVNGRNHYCKVENKGNYLYLMGEIPNVPFSDKYKFKKSMIENYPVSMGYGGAIGGAVTGAQLAMIKVFYLFDTNSGKIELLTRDNLLLILSTDSGLMEQLKKCEPNYNTDFLIKFLNQINQKN